MQISNSQVDKYETCPWMWYLHYIERIRSLYKPSALFFGSALDEAFGRLHLDKMAPELREQHAEMLEYSAEELFKKTMETQQHNGEDLFLPTSSYTSFFKSDFDLSLLTDEDFQRVADFATELGMEVAVDDVSDFTAECFSILKKGQLAGSDRRLFNLVGWLSLYRKGLILIDGYRKIVMPQIAEVYAIQEKVELPDGHGNTYIGYIDYIARWEGEDFKRVCDDKTSSRAYAEDAVRNSTQLASYCEFVGVNTATYTVVEKGIRKREPRYRVQILHDEIPEEQFELTFDRILGMIEAVEAGVFPKASEREGGAKENCFLFGRKCDYWNLCHGDGSMKGLVQLSEKETEPAKQPTEGDTK